MGWLQKRVQTTEATGFYTVGQNKNILLVGLGNPGKEYDLTRHNVGFHALDHFVDKTDEMDGWIDKKDLKCLMSNGRAGENRVIAIKPTTYMNLSGEAVQATAAFYKIPTANILVIHDELDIDFGQIRTRTGGSSTHNGIKSVTQHLGEDYGRVRIGVGPKRPAKIDGADFVLQKFSAAEQAQLPNLNKEVNAILTEYLYGGQLPHETRSFLI
jgi:peptidyl-tRNA hydrolase, PTH1 family